MRNCWLSSTDDAMWDFVYVGLIFILQAIFWKRFLWLFAFRKSCCPWFCFRLFFKSSIAARQLNISCSDLERYFSVHRIKVTSHKRTNKSLDYVEVIESKGNHELLLFSCMLKERLSITNHLNFFLSTSCVLDPSFFLPLKHVWYFLNLNN